MNSLTDSFLVWWLRTGRRGWAQVRRRLFERGYLKVPLPDVGSLTDINFYLSQVKWTADSLSVLYDCISYPQKVWAAKKDDCDGFAVLAAALLNKLNPEYHPVLLTVGLQPISNCHTVCAFRAPGDLIWFFDNNYLRKFECRTYYEIVDIIKGKDRLICWDIREPESLKLMEFHTA